MNCAFCFGRRKAAGWRRPEGTTARHAKENAMRGWKRFALMAAGVLIFLAVGYYGLVLLLTQAIR